MNWNDEFLARAEERNQIRERLGLPPLSPDGMIVLGDYADYWHDVACEICRAQFGEKAMTEALVMVEQEIIAT